MTPTAWFLMLQLCTTISCHWVSAVDFYRTPEFAPYADRDACERAGRARMRDSRHWSGYRCEERGLER